MPLLIVSLISPLVPVSLFPFKFKLSLSIVVSFQLQEKTPSYALSFFMDSVVVYSLYVVPQVPLDDVVVTVALIDLSCWLKFQTPFESAFNTKPFIVTLVISAYPILIAPISEAPNTTKKSSPDKNHL